LVKRRHQGQFRNFKYARPLRWITRMARSWSLRLAKFLEQAESQDEITSTFSQLHLFSNRQTLLAQYLYADDLLPKRLDCYCLFVTK